MVQLVFPGNGFHIFLFCKKREKKVSFSTLSHVASVRVRKSHIMVHRLVSRRHPPPKCTIILGAYKSKWCDPCRLIWPERIGERCSRSLSCTEYPVARK